MAEHSKTPWRTALGNRGRLCIISDEAWICGELANGNGEQPGEGEANAAFIVTACNAHDDLLRALQLVRMSAGWSIMSEETRALIIAAISKAEGC